MRIAPENLPPGSRFKGFQTFKVKELELQAKKANEQIEVEKDEAIEKSTLNKSSSRSLSFSLKLGAGLSALAGAGLIYYHRVSVQSLLSRSGLIALAKHYSRPGS